MLAGRTTHWKRAGQTGDASRCDGEQALCENKKSASLKNVDIYGPGKPVFYTQSASYPFHQKISAQIVFAPILWAQGTLRKARSDGLFPSDFLYKAIHE